MMTDSAALEVRRLSMEVERLIASLSPWLSVEEMCARYSCTPQTLRNMERRGDIPTRSKGRWDRQEVIQWEREK